MRTLAAILALAVVGLAFSTFTLATSAPYRGAPDQPDERSSVALPCQLEPSGEAVWLLLNNEKPCCLEPAQDIPPTGVRVLGETSRAWVFVVMADEQPDVLVVDRSQVATVLGRTGLPVLPASQSSRP